MKHNINALIFGTSMLLLAACNQPAGNTDSGKDRAADMKARFTKLNDAFNTGKTEAIDSLLSANSVDHEAEKDTSMHMPKGPAGLKQMIAEMRTGTPDLKSDIKYMAVDGDILIAYGTMGGTNSGPMHGMAPTNKKWSGEYADVVKFGSDMKMTDHWGVYDGIKIMKDLGLMPAQGQAPATAAMATPAETKKH